MHEGILELKIRLQCETEMTQTFFLLKLNRHYDYIFRLKLS